MKAVLMAGGEGSRLRPLTVNRPKPMVPLVDRPVMEHTIELLKIHGITEIVITVQYLAAVIQDYFGDGSAFGVQIEYSVEESPLGTAGSVKLAQHLLEEPFLVISGDALTDIDLTSLITFHNTHCALATLTLKHVPNPLEYGVIITDEDKRIIQFLEKPSWGELFSDTVNTGIYVIDPKVLDMIQPGVNVDWSKDVFPKMLERGEQLYGFVAEGYWTDIGTLQEYMRATSDYLRSNVQLPRLGERIRDEIWVEGDVEIAPDAQLNGPIFLGYGVKIKSGASIHGPTVIRDYTIIDVRTTVDRSIIWRNSYIGERAELRGAIVGRQCNIKSRAVLFEGGVVGDQTVVNSGAVLQPDVKIWPSKQIDEGAIVNSSLIWGSQGRRALFSKNGITGLVNIDITPEFCAKLGAAYGGILPKGSTVLINREGHYAPRMLKRAINSGLPAAGVHVGDVQTVPIPVARYLVYATGAAGGIHVRLSPSDSRVVDIKFFDGFGVDIDTTTERKLENSFFREDYRRVYLDEIGRIAYTQDVAKIYVDGFFRALRPEALEAIAHRFNVVIDYANVDSSGILPAILHQLHCNALEINVNFDQDRLYPTTQEVEAGIQQLAAIVPVVNAEFGVRIDSGGEMVFIVDDTGRRLSELETLAMATDLVFRTYGGGTVAVPTSAPRAFEAIAARYGGQIVRTRANISALMQYAVQRRDLLLLGDAAGHLIFPSFHPTADGLFAIVKLMELIALQNVKISEIVDSLPHSHIAQTWISCRWENKGKVMRILNERYTEQGVEQIDGVKIDLGDEWVLIRPEPDGPFFQVVAEGSTDILAQALVDKYASLVTNLQ